MDGRNNTGEAWMLSSVLEGLVFLRREIVQSGRRVWVGSCERLSRAAEGFGLAVANGFPGRPKGLGLQLRTPFQGGFGGFGDLLAQ